MDIDKDIKSLIKSLKVSSKDVKLQFFNSIKKEANLQSLNEHLRSIKYKKEITSFQKLRLTDSIYAHSSHITRICLDKRNEILFTSGEDTFLKAWDINQGILMHTILGARAPITDLCMSNDNRFICSVDNTGLLNIYTLNNFSLIFTYDLCSEVDFIEFIKLPKQRESNLNEFINKNINLLDHLIKEDEGTFLQYSKEDEYILVLVERIGLIHTLTFNYDSIKSVYTNKTMLELAADFSLSSLCITEGGRFLLIGGNFPFLIIFDLYNLEDNFCIEETGGVNVSFVAAGRSFKFAAATSLELVIIFEYIPEAHFRSGKFKRKNFEEYGAWRKTTINLKNTTAEVICFLKDESYLSMLCGDSTFRVYHNNTLIRKVNLMGNLLFSYNNLSYVVNNDTIYILSPLINDKIEQTIVNLYEISDIACTDEYLIVVDESGRINYYGKRNRIDNLPNEQFLKSELEFLTIEGEDDKIYDAMGRDTSFYISKKQIHPFFIDRMPYLLEERGFYQLKDDFINLNTFKKKFLYQEEIPQEEESFSIESFSDNEENDKSGNEIKRIRNERMSSKKSSSDESSSTEVKRRGRRPRNTVYDDSTIDSISESESDTDFTTVSDSDTINVSESSFEAEESSNETIEVNRSIPRRSAAINASKVIKEQFNYLYAKDEKKKGEQNALDEKVNGKSESSLEINESTNETIEVNRSIPRRSAAINASKVIKEQFNYLYAKDEKKKGEQNALDEKVNGKSESSSEINESTNETIEVNRSRPRRSAAINASKIIKEEFNFLYANDEKEKQNVVNKSTINRKKKIQGDLSMSDSDSSIKKRRRKKGVTFKNNYNKINNSESTMSSNITSSSEYDDISESDVKKNKNNPGKRKIGKEPRIYLKKLTDKPSEKKTKAQKDRKIKGTNRRRKKRRTF